MDKIKKLQPEWVSRCCYAGFTEPGWPDSDFCSRCKEHADAVDANELTDDGDEK